METKDDRVGTRREFEIRDDDRPSDTAYSPKRPLGSGLLIIAALALIAGCAAYLVVFGSGQPTGASVPAGSTQSPR